MTNYVRSGVRSRTEAGWPYISIGVEGKPATILVLYGRTNEEQVAAEREAALVVRALNADHYPSHEALVDLVQLWAEYEALTGGGPGWQERFRGALAIANELTRREP